MALPYVRYTYVQCIVMLIYLLWNIYAMYCYANLFVIEYLCPFPFMKWTVYVGSIFVYCIRVKNLIFKI